MHETRPKTYADKFNRVFDYIEENLNGDLSVDRLSKVANFSKYHFHRQFSEYVGITVFKYIQLMRLKRASYRLVFNERAPIVDIAFEAGFENSESFSRAFKSTFEQTPSQFRKSPQWSSWINKCRAPSIDRSKRMEVKVVDFVGTDIAVLEHRGSPHLVNDTARLFIEWRKESGLSPVGSSRTFGVVYDDPAVVAPEDFRFDICGSVLTAVPGNRQGIINKTIPAGRCAVIRHIGSHDQLDGNIYYLYREWLPDSGESLRDCPLFFHYLNLISETPEHELITDIYLPLQ